MSEAVSSYSVLLLEMFSEGTKQSKRVRVK